MPFLRVCVQEWRIPVTRLLHGVLRQDLPLEQADTQNHGIGEAQGVEDRIHSREDTSPREWAIKNIQTNRHTVRHGISHDAKSFGHGVWIDAYHCVLRVMGGKRLFNLC